MSTIVTYVKAHKIVAIAAILVILGGAYLLSNKKQASPYETVAAVRGDLVQEVSVTGRVESQNEVSLAFERGGRVKTEPRKVGEKVRKGDVLVRLDASELEVSRAQAIANLEYENARLSEIMKGSRPEDVAITESQVKSAENSLADARLSLMDKLSLSLDALQDAVYSKTDTFYENPRTTAPRFTLPVTDQKLVSSYEVSRVDIGKDLSALTLFESDLDGSTASIRALSQEVKSYLDQLLLGVSNVTPSSAYTQTTIDGWKTNVLAARTNVTAAYTALLAAEEKYRAAAQALEIAKNQLELKKAPATPESIAAQQAKIAATRSSIANYDVQIAKMLLRAPFSGVITEENAKLGETISMNMPVVSLMSDGGYKITANIPEVDVAKIKLGNKARVTLDAYGSDVVFPAEVGMIDPAETIIEGVSTYKVTLIIDRDDRIRSGMTANIDIETARRENVLKVPARAVTTKEEGKYVRVPDGASVKEVPVTIGLRGSDGMVEIVSGLSEGESVVTFEKK